MGFEYQFKINTQDLENMSRYPDAVNNLDTFLSSAPFFIAKTGITYTYTDQPDNSDKWQSTININPSGFCLCIYTRAEKSSDMQLLNYLIYELLNRCGRLEVEDA